MKNPANNQTNIGIAASIDAKGDYAGQFKSISQQEEERAKNHVELPYTLTNMTDRLGEVLVKMIEIRNSCTRTKAISKKTDVIDHLQNKIDNINHQIFSLTDDLYRLKLSDD